MYNKKKVFDTKKMAAFNLEMSPALLLGTFLSAETPKRSFGMKFI